MIERTPAQRVEAARLFNEIEGAFSEPERLSELAAEVEAAEIIDFDRVHALSRIGQYQLDRERVAEMQGEE